VRFLANQATGGRGFEDRENFNEDSFNWNLFRGKASDIGALLPQVADYFINGDSSGSDGKNPKEDPFQRAEDMISGWWASIRGGYKDEGLLGGFAGAVSGYADFVATGMSNAYDDTKKSWTFMNLLGGFGVIDSVLGYAGQALSWLKETISNLFSGKNNSNPENAPENLGSENLAGAIRKLKETEHSLKNAEMISKLEQYQQKIADKEQANEQKAENGEWYSVFENTKEAFDYIQTKKELGLPLDANDAKMLAQTMKQRNENGQFAKELSDFIRDNKDKFAGFKIPGLDLEDNKSIENFADKISKGSCFINTIFMNIVLSSVKDGVPASWGDMYLKAMESGLIQKDGISSTQYMNTQKGVQSWVDGIIGKNKLIVEGYFKGDGTPSSEMFQKIQTLANRGVLASGGRFKNNHHSMMQALTGGTWGVYDTGFPSSKNPRPYGTPYDVFYGEDTNSFWILKPK
jgi:hypothetical protein